MPGEMFEGFAIWGMFVENKAKQCRTNIGGEMGSRSSQRATSSFILEESASHLFCFLGPTMDDEIACTSHQKCSKTMIFRKGQNFGENVPGANLDGFS